jgi:hypothetical protein
MIVAGAAIPAIAVSLFIPKLECAEGATLHLSILLTICELYWPVIWGLVAAYLIAVLVLAVLKLRSQIAGRR